MKVNQIEVTGDRRKDIPLFADKILRGAIAKFSSLREDRFINASNAYLHVLEAEKETITACLMANKDPEMLIRLEAVKKITKDLVQAFNDFYPNTDNEVSDAADN